MRYAMALMNGARLAVGAQAWASPRRPTARRTAMPANASSSASPIGELPAVARMLLSMRGEIEAGAGADVRDRACGWTC